MRIATLTRSFAAGEITPELFGRIDLTKYQTGLKTCRNFEVLPHGPVANSPGFEYILETKNSAKQSVLIPFIFNTTQAYQLEFGDQYIRFHTQAGTVLEAGGAITAITQANPGVVTQNAHGYTNGQVVFLSGIGGMTQLNGRFAVVTNKAANTYELFYFDGTKINTTAYGAYTAGGAGARVYEIASPYLEADLQDLHYTQSADVMTITHPSYDKRELKRIGATNWTLSVISFAQIQVPEANPIILKVGAAGTPKLAEYLVSFVSANTLEESVSYYPRFNAQFGGATATITGVTNAINPVFTTAGAHLLAVNDVVAVRGVTGLNGFFDYYVGIVSAVPTGVTFTLMDLITRFSIDTTTFSAYGAGSGTMIKLVSLTGYTGVNPGVFTTNANHGFVSGDPVAVEGAVLGGISAPQFSLVVDTVPSATTFTLKDGTTGLALDMTPYAGLGTASGLARMVGVYNDLTVAGQSNNIKMATGLTLVPSFPLPSSTVFLRYNVYKKLNGLYGFIGASVIPGTFVDNNILPDLTFTPQIANNPFSSVNNYPGAVGYWQGRRWFAGSNNAPQGVFATKSGTESNPTYRIPGLADDAIQVQLKARRADTIRHIIPGTDLLLLTSGGEWKINSSGQGPVTPSNISYTPEDYVGSSNVTPIVIGGSVLYSQDRGCRVRELNFVWQQQNYRSTDLSVMAPHLFDAFTIKSMAYTRAPYSFAWSVRSDGVLLGLTYVPDQQVAAWFHRDTNGFFESVCSTPEGTEDVLYAIIRRVINGRTVRYFERQRTRQLSALASSFFVDAGSTYNGAPATTISGFYHLENTPVTVLADGAVVPGLTVLNGSITLPQAASLVSGGLGYNCDLETLPLSYEAAALGQGVTKNVDEVMLRVHQSSSIKIGPSLTKLTEVKQRTTEPWGSPPSLVSEMLPVKINPSWNQDGGIAIRQANPLPLMVLSMSLKVAVGG